VQKPPIFPCWYNCAACSSPYNESKPSDNTNPDIHLFHELLKPPASKPPQAGVRRKITGRIFNHDIIPKPSEFHTLLEIAYRLSMRKVMNFQIVPLPSISIVS
jgi:hypothetical protein